MTVRLPKRSVIARRSILPPFVAVWLLLIPAAPRLTSAQKFREPAKPSGAHAELIARGEYIVEGLAACGDCHTPKDRNGQPDRARWLEGAPLFLEPARPVAGWPNRAPRLAGIPPARDAQMIQLLTTGIWINGKPLRRPMPRFHMTRSDAEAVLAYLKSL